MTRLALPAAVLLTTVAAWLSQATLAVATPDGPRIALLPVSAGALIVVAIAGLAVVAAARAALPLTPVWLLLLILLPWLPIDLPPPVLMWAGAIHAFVWAGVALLVLWPGIARAWPRLSAGSAGEWLRASPRLTAGGLACAIFLASAWFVSPSVPGGDEPHYLVITQSLLLDRDLKIENNHRRGDYHAYFGGALPPHYIQRGRDGEIYSIHAPGLSAMVAPAFAIGGYRAVVLLLIVVAACGSALAWHLGDLATRRTDAAWFGWAAVTLSATAIFHSFSVYPDGPGGVIALTGVWAILRAGEERGSGATSVRPWLLHGAALALLPWMHSRFALLAGCVGALVLLRLPLTKNPAAKAAAFLSVPIVSAVAWLSFFFVIYGRLDPSAPYGSTRDFSLAFVPGGLTGLLFDQRFGLVANAPVLLFGFAGLILMLRRRTEIDGAPGGRRLALELLFVIVPYLVTATSYAMWWAGWSAPARFANPAVFLLAIPCAVLWASAGHRATRVVAAAALAMTAAMSVLLVTIDGGRLAYNTRETTALWLDWASSLVPLGEGLPVWYRGQEGIFARDVAIWAAILTAAFLALRALSALPALRDVIRYATAVAAAGAIAFMVAVGVTWGVKRTETLSPAPAQLAALRRLAEEPRLVPVTLSPPGPVDRATLLAMMRIEAASRGGGGRGRDEQPMVSLPSLPAGRYRISARTRGPGGWLLIGLGQDQFALRSEPLTYPPAPLEIDLPVAVRALVVRGDEDARRVLRSVTVEPVSLVGVEARVSDRVARRAVKYDAATVYFLDDGCFVEPESFWVGGARQCSLVVQPSRPGSSATLLIRNAPVANEVVLEAGQWRESLALAPGEERQVRVPIAPGRGAAMVTAATTTGFRPSESIAQSRDERFLGVWVKVIE